MSAAFVIACINMFTIYMLIKTIRSLCDQVDILGARIKKMEDEQLDITSKNRGEA